MIKKKYNMTAEVAQQENNNIKYYVSAFKYI